MTALQVTAAILIALARVCSVVLVARISTAPARYTWVQAILVFLLATLAFAPVSFIIVTGVRP